MRSATAAFFFLASQAVLGLDNGFDRPPMSWSALYGAPFTTVNETMMMVAAQSLNESGLLAAGYNYVVLDDWYVLANRSSDGSLVVDPATFPSGMPVR